MVITSWKDPKHREAMKLAHQIRMTNSAITIATVGGGYTVVGTGYVAPEAIAAIYSACRVNPAGCTVIAVESTDVLAGLATGAVTVSNLPASAIKSTSKIGGKYAEEASKNILKTGKGMTENFLEWNSWQNYQKMTVAGKQYAQIGDRLYSQHAVDRMQPSGLGAPAGTVGAGRNISPSIVEHTIQNGIKTTSTVNGVERTVHWSGDVGVVTESNGKIVVTILRRSKK